MDPKPLSCVISDLRTRRLAELKKETFVELLEIAGVPCRYFCRRSFVTWDVLLPSEDLAKKLAENTVTTRFFRLQPEYKDFRRIRLTVCNVPIGLNGNAFAAFLSDYGDVEEVLLARSAAGTAHGDYILNMCLNREGFQAISHIIAYEDQNMMVFVKSWRPLYCACKQLGYVARSCTLKTTKPKAKATTAANSATSPSKSELELRDYPDKEERWTQVIHNGRKPPTTQKQSNNNNNNSNNNRSSSTSINNNYRSNNNSRSNNIKSNSSSNI